MSLAHCLLAQSLPDFSALPQAKRLPILISSPQVAVPSANRTRLGFGGGGNLAVKGGLREFDRFGSRSSGGRGCRLIQARTAATALPRLPLPDCILGRLTSSIIAS